MASHLASRIRTRIAQSSFAAQQCACNASTCAGPSVILQAHHRRRNLHTSPQAWQAGTQAQESRLEQRTANGSRRLQGVKAETATDSDARLASVSNPVQTRRHSSISPAESGTVTAGTPESAVTSATESAPSKLPSFSFARPRQHPRTHDNLVCTLRLSSYSDSLENLTFFAQFCVHAAYAFGLPCTLPASLPTKSSLRTVPRSPFVHKPSQENFVKKEHKRLLKIYDSDLGAVGQWIDYISENSMSGVRIKATTWESKPVGFGKDMVSDAKSLETTEGQKVKEMAERILAAGFGEGTGKQTSDNQAEIGVEGPSDPKESTDSSR